MTTTPCTDDRWTCPSCGRTELVANDRQLRRVQTRHATEHSRPLDDLAAAAGAR
jgi:hypothetical protein